jgi:hypothetical protein
MAIINLTLASMAPQPVLPMYTASQQLMDILRAHRFVDIPGMGGSSMRRSDQYVSGRNYYFRKHGQCTVNFLKDGRVHVLHGPIALWNLHDALSPEELTILIAFATMSEEHQELMRNVMGPRCQRYSDVLRHLPAFKVDWKQEFLKAYSIVAVD